jgi:hypothetical protein
MLKVTLNIKSFGRAMKRKEKAVSKAVDKGLAHWAKIAHIRARKNLSAEGAQKYGYVKGKYKRRKAAPAKGVYPVPTVTGWLKKNQDYVIPVETKSGITAKHGQAWLFNTAIYAHAIHEGNGPHKKHGPRPFILDAIKDTRMQGIMAIRIRVRKAIEK